MKQLLQFLEYSRHLLEYSFCVVQMPYMYLNHLGKKVKTIDFMTPSLAAIV